MADITTENTCGILSADGDVLSVVSNMEEEVFGAVLDPVTYTE